MSQSNKMRRSTRNINPTNSSLTIFLNPEESPQHEKDKMSPKMSFDSKQESQTKNPIKDDANIKKKNERLKPVKVQEKKGRTTRESIKKLTKKSPSEKNVMKESSNMKSLTKVAKTNKKGKDQGRNVKKCSIKSKPAKRTKFNKDEPAEIRELVVALEKDSIIDLMAERREKLILDNEFENVIGVEEDSSSIPVDPDSIINNDLTGSIKNNFDQLSKNELNDLKFKNELGSSEAFLESKNTINDNTQEKIKNDTLMDEDIKNVSLKNVHDDKQVKDTNFNSITLRPGPKEKCEINFNQQLKQNFENLQFASPILNEEDNELNNKMPKPLNLKEKLLNLSIPIKTLPTHKHRCTKGYRSKTRGKFPVERRFSENLSSGYSSTVSLNCEKSSNSFDYHNKKEQLFNVNDDALSLESENSVVDYSELCEPEEVERYRGKLEDKFPVERNFCVENFNGKNVKIHSNIVITPSSNTNKNNFETVKSVKKFKKIRLRRKNIYEYNQINDSNVLKKYSNLVQRFI